MYCKKCGAQVDDDVKFCPRCGDQLKGYPQATPQPRSDADRTNTYAIVGFIMAFFFPLVGFILSIIGISKAQELGGKGKGLAVAGLVISLLDVIAIILIVVIAVGMAAL